MTTRNVEAAKFLLMAAMHREKVAARIRARRKELGLTQQEVADAAAVTSNTVSRWERGKNLSREGNLERVADALQITVAELMAGIEPDRPPVTGSPLDVFAEADRPSIDAKLNLILERLDLIGEAVGVSLPGLEVATAQIAQEVEARAEAQAHDASSAQREAS